MFDGLGLYLYQSWREVLTLHHVYIIRETVCTRIKMGMVCVTLFYYTDIGESLRSRGQFLTAVDLGWPDPHPKP